MRILEHTTETRIKVMWSMHQEFKDIVSLLRAGLGQYSSTLNGVKFWWSTEGMVAQLGRGVVAETLASTLQDIPASSGMVHLLEIMIEDWQTVDRTYEHKEPEQLAKVIECLASKRDEMRNFLREEPCMNGPRINSERSCALGEPVGIEAFNAALSASR